MIKSSKKSYHIVLKEVYSSPIHLPHIQYVIKLHHIAVPLTYCISDVTSAHHHRIIAHSRLALLATSAASFPAFFSRSFATQRAISYTHHTLPAPTKELQWRWRRTQRRVHAVSLSEARPARAQMTSDWARPRDARIVGRRSCFPNLATYELLQYIVLYFTRLM